MSDDVKIEVTCWDGKGGASFDWKRHGMSTLTVWIEHDDLTIEGLQYEGEGSIRIPIDIIKRAIAAAEVATKPEGT